MGGNFLSKLIWLVDCVRIFSDDRRSEADILAGHFQSTRERFAATTGTTLILHDTSEFSYQRARPDLIGIMHKNHYGRDEHGESRFRTICGILMHSSLWLPVVYCPPGLYARLPSVYPTWLNPV